MAEKEKKNDNVLIKNKKAFHDYTILEAFEAGIELKGTEVKSCRKNSIALVDSFVKVENGQATLLNCHIAPYVCGNRFNHEPLRPRRLLLRKAELRKLSIQLREKGNTIIPLKFYLKNGKVKLEIGVAKGKTHGDKREAMRRNQDEKDARREMSARR